MTGGVRSVRLTGGVYHDVPGDAPMPVDMLPLPALPPYRFSVPISSLSGLNYDLEPFATENGALDTVSPGQRSRIMAAVKGKKARVESSPLPASARTLLSAPRPGLARHARLGLSCKEGRGLCARLLLASMPSLPRRQPWSKIEHRLLVRKAYLRRTIGNRCPTANVRRCPPLPPDRPSPSLI
jgi:hypothetical protein